jgi:hypothetical protein
MQDLTYEELLSKYAMKLFLVMKHTFKIGDKDQFNLVSSKTSNFTLKNLKILTQDIDVSANSCLWNHIFLDIFGDYGCIEHSLSHFGALFRRSS